MGNEKMLQKLYDYMIGWNLKQAKNLEKMIKKQNKKLKGDK